MTQRILPLLLIGCVGSHVTLYTDPSSYAPRVGFAGTYVPRAPPEKRRQRKKHLMHSIGEVPEHHSEAKQSWHELGREKARGACLGRI
jgi:hypothetical protein